ncbi:DUF1482 family protein, partial [Klebsiella pneumoniae]|uniref:DUF1482 family protein n=1 Tax=Klebsiella pneumoniae TaxID=573 RepID=UPI003AF100B0
QTETEATGAPQKHHYTLNQQVGSITLTVSMLTGGNQDVLLGVYDTENDCKAAAEEQHVKAECYPLKGVLDEHPAGFTVQM